VTKQQASNQGFYVIAFCAGLFAIAALWGVYHTQQIVPAAPPPPMHSTMSEADQIKQKIREAETLRDSYTTAQEAAANSRDFEASSEWARQAAEQEALIKQLYDDLHDANMKEGSGDEAPPNG
jgi:hypothetical protein